MSAFISFILWIFLLKALKHIYKTLPRNSVATFSLIFLHSLSLSVFISIFLSLSLSPMVTHPLSVFPYRFAINYSQLFLPIFSRPTCAPSTTIVDFSNREEIKLRYSDIQNEMYITFVTKWHGESDRPTLLSLQDFVVGLWMNREWIERRRVLTDFFCSLLSKSIMALLQTLL